MRSVLVVLAVIGIGLLLGCRHGDLVPMSIPRDVVARYHFVGGAQLAADTNAAKLQELWNLPASSAFREQTLHKMAKAAYELVKQRVTPGAPENAALIRPLLDDLLSAESFAELRGATNRTAELVFAIKLTEAQAQVWNKNLSAVLSGWTGIPTRAVQASGFNGWELRKHDAPNLFRFTQAGGWMVIGCGQDQLPSHTEIVQRIKSRNRPIAVAKDYWLSAWTDGPCLSQWIPKALPFKLPQIQLTLSGVEDNLQTKISLTFPRSLEWQIELWQIPTNTIGDAIVSFTAVQGISPSLAKQSFVSDLEVRPLPNQFCSWAESRMPFQTFVAVPTRNGTNLFEQLAPKLMSRIDTNLEQHHLGHAQWQTNDTEVKWGGLPIIAPFLRSIQDSGREFLIAGLFPNSPPENPLPSKLLSPLMGRTNLTYYDWERTSARFSQVRLLTQAYGLIVNQPSGTTNSPGFQWFEVVGPKLGNTVTEMTVTKPNELTLVRISQIGFTAFELERLTDWLDGPNFPLLGYQLPFNPTRPPAKTTPAR